MFIWSHRLVHLFYLLFLSPIVFLILFRINAYLNFVSVSLLDMTILSPIYLYFLFSFHLHCICISFLCNILFIFILNPIHPVYFIPFYFIESLFLFYPLSFSFWCAMFIWSHRLVHLFYFFFLSPIVFLILFHINVYLNFVSVSLLVLTILSPIYLYFLFWFQIHCICILFLCNVLFIFISYYIPMLIPDIYLHCLSAIPIIGVFINTIIITIIILIYAHFISRILLYPCLIPICFQYLVSFYINFI